MAIDINKTYAVPGWALALLATAAGGGLVWGGFNLDTAQAKSVNHKERVNADLTGAEKACIVGAVNGSFCDAVESQFSLSADTCSAVKVLARKVGNIDITTADRDEPPDGVEETLVMGVQLSMPGSLSVEMP